MDLSGRSRLNPPTEEYTKTLERLYGWNCWYCKIKNKEDKCQNCQRDKKDAKLG